MATAKYNWEEVKQKYFEAPEIEVKAFLITFLSLDQKTADGGYYKKITVGWRKEKEEFLKKQTEKAKRDLENDPKIKLANENILGSIKAIEKKVADLLKTEYFTKEDLPKVKVGWEILRVSQNLPTTYSKNENENTNVNIDTVLKELEE
jgi:hypothetical protein